MNSLMLNTHHNYPEWTVPVDRQFYRSVIYYLKNCFFYLITIYTYLMYRRPVIMIIIQIIPNHLIYTNSEYGFKFRINSMIYDLGQKELINKKSCSMTKIKQNNMS